MSIKVFKNNSFCDINFGDGRISDFISEFEKLIPEGLDFSVSELPDSLSVKKFISEIFSSLKGEGSGILSFLSLLLLWVVFSYFAGINEKRNSEAIRCGISILFSLSLMYTLAPAFLSLGKSLKALGAFFSSAIPVLSVVTMAGGGNSSAKVQAFQMTLTSAGVGLISLEILLPLTMIMLPMSALACFEGGFVRRIIASLKNSFTKFFSFLCVITGIIFSLQTVISSAADNASIRLAKFTAGTLLPSVGSLVSSSLSTIISGASYAKGVIGASAIYVILIIFLSPLPMLILYRLSISLASSFSDMLGASAGKSLSAFLSSLDSVISVYVLSSLLYILEIFLFMKGGVSV